MSGLSKEDAIYFDGLEAGSINWHVFWRGVYYDRRGNFYMWPQPNPYPKGTEEYSLWSDAEYDGWEQTAQIESV